MTIVKVIGGYKIRLESGNLLPKVYSSKEEAQKRISQMKSFKTKEKLIFEVQDFKTSVIEKEGKNIGLKMVGTALQEGVSRNKRNYTIDNLKENDGEPFNFIVGHREDYDNPDHNVGEGVYSLNGNRLDFEGTVFNNAHHPDIVEQIEPRNVVSVSVQGGYKNVNVKDGKVVFEGLRIPILALVNKHARGVPAASIEAAIAEAEKLEEAEMENTEDFAKLLKEKDSKVDELEKELKDVKEKLDVSAEDAKKRKAKEQEALDAKKEKVIESIIEINKEIKQKDIKDKTLSELELMESYEKKIHESGDGETEESASEVEDVPKSKEIKEEIVIDKNSGHITMSEKMRLQYNEDMMNSIYR